MDINNEALNRIAALSDHVLKLREEMNAMRTVFIGTLASLSEDTQNQEGLAQAIAASVAAQVRHSDGMGEEAILRGMQLMLAMTPPDLWERVQQILLDQS